MAVGNFKRSAGTILPPPIANSTSPPDENRCSCYLIPTATGATIALSCDEPVTWERLTKMSGLGAPTATTALAAIWRDDHIIMDKRTVQGAIGLSAGTTWNVNGLGGRYLPVRGWQFYAGWYRPTVLRTAETLHCKPVASSVPCFIWTADEEAAQTSGSDMGWLPPGCRWLDRHAPQLTQARPTPGEATVSQPLAASGMG
jgi:hypothetical protein